MNHNNNQLPGPDPSAFALRPEEEAILLKSFNYIRALPKKQIRTKMVVGFNKWFKVDEEILGRICEIVEQLHDASLLIDDIEDSSELRRGRPCAHKIFGVPQTLNTANLVYFIALEKTLALNHPMTATVFTSQLLELHRGQGMEIYWRDSFICPTEDEYISTALRKTGGLFMLAIRLLKLFSSDERDLQKLVSLLGLFFQIRDDYANLMLTEYSDSKSFCEDITEGKFSFPIIHAIKSHPEDDQIASILRQRTQSKVLKQHVISLLEEFGSLEYTRQKLTKFSIEILSELEGLGGNDFLEALVAELMSKIKVEENDSLENALCFAKNHLI